jgi:hypothetical protein
MRYVRNCLSDPSLHLLAIALILVYLALGDRSTLREGSGEEPLAFCPKCRVHHLPEKTCDCVLPRKVADASP